MSLGVASGPVQALGMEVRNAADDVKLTTPTAVALATALARDLELQGRAARWSFTSGVGGSYSFHADKAGEALTLACEKGSTTYDLVVEARGTGSGSRRLPGVPLLEGESHRVAPGDWANLAGTDVAVEVDQDGDGVADRQAVATRADVTVDPQAINSRALGLFVTVSLELPWEWRAARIDPASVRLGETLATIGPSGTTDKDGDGIPETQVKFSRAAVVSRLGVGNHLVRFSGRAVSGEDSIYFEGEGRVNIFK